MRNTRSSPFDPFLGAVHHCVSRCVRGESLIEDRARCAWIVARLERLAAFLAIDVCDVAVTRNQVRLLLRTHPEIARAWSDEEVVRRRLSVALLGCGGVKPAHADSDAALTDPALIASWRTRLSDLGWFHKLWKEPAARAWNLDIGMTGRFWEARYADVGSADERALLLKATYLLHNPVHCRVAPGFADHAPASRRLQLRRLIRAIEAGRHRRGVQIYEAALRDPAIPCCRGSDSRDEANPEWSRGFAAWTCERALREAAAEDANRRGRVQRG